MLVVISHRGRRAADEGVPKLRLAGFFVDELRQRLTAPSPREILLLVLPPETRM